MIRTFLLLCLYLLALAFCYWLLVLVVLPAMGFTVPAILAHILMAIFFVIALILLWDAFGGWVQGFDWRLRRRDPPPAP